MVGAFWVLHDTPSLDEKKAQHAVFLEMGSHFAVQVVLDLTM